MAKKKQTEKTETKKRGEQLDLIDVRPENVKPILQATRLYKKFQAARLSAGNKEVAQREVVLQLVKEAKLQPLPDGKIRFKCNGVIITITPRDALITIKEKTEKPE